MKKVIASGISLLSLFFPAAAQNYHAVQGSSYAGSLGIANNPASMLSTPFGWDLTLAGAQFKSSTNIITIHDFSLLSPSKNSSYSINPGDFERMARVNANLNLLNARIALDRKTAIGFGVNVRSHGRIKTNPFNYNDSISSVREFFDSNPTNRPLAGKFIESSWVEIFGSYSRTIWDRHDSRLNAGITLRASRGLSGAFANADDIRFQSHPQGGYEYFTLTSGRVSYGYSSNYDRIDDNKNTSQNARDFLAYTEGGAAFDLGVEYLIKSGAIPIYDEDDYFDYDWKIGLSILDVGLNQYKYGTESAVASGLVPNLADSVLEQKFTDISGLEEANDSLATIVQSFVPLSGKFSILNPTRLVINVDRFLYDAFYINMELSLNLSSLAGDKYHHVDELNLITVTPRWETKNLGVYMPIQINAAGNFWVGGAFKAGPLLFGVHNLSNIFSKV
ncbi:MAG TPA: hypothetical protein VEV87_10220, partial [Chitinophagaceae bacterium]|nr:hypothetical protein [Chitinophagaceae bacterium]